MARAATRITLRHDDLAGQRRWLDAVRAEPYTGLPRQLPRVTRPKPEPQDPPTMLFACLPEAKRPPKTREMPRAVAPLPEPAPDEFSAEELDEIESYVAHGQNIGRSGDQATRRWDAWIMEGRAVERKILQLPGVNARADVQVMETRLGWAANVSYATTKKSGRHPWLMHRPQIDTDCRFFWRTRDAAIAYSANMAWRLCLEHQGHERERRSWAKFAQEMQEFLARCGIDVAIAPPASMKRVLVTAARERELKAGAPPAPAPAPAPAATTPLPAQAPAAPKPEAAEDRVKPPRVEKSLKRTPAQLIAETGMLSMREPTQPDRTEIHAAIGEILPPGVPTYIRDILAVNRAPGQKGGRIIADVQMFDGETGRIEFNGPPGGRSYRWHSIGPEGTTCFWDRQEGRWKRVPKQA